MSYRFLSQPKYVEPEAYSNTIDKVVETLKQEKDIVSINQFGNANHPGISDVDILVVFEDEVRSDLDPSVHFDKMDSYLITHGLLGVSRSFFERTSPYTSWDNMKCIYGERLVAEDTIGMDEAYLTQTALEFMIRNFIDLSVQRRYGVIKLRNILQQLKGIRYDIAYLDIQDEPLNDYIIQLLNWLDNWFENPIELSMFGNWLDEYYEALKKTLSQLALQNQKVYVTHAEGFSYGRNIFVVKGEQFECRGSGLVLPNQLTAKNRKIFNAQQRINSFRISLNYTTTDYNNKQQERVQIFSEYKKYNQGHYAHFNPLISSFLYQFI